MSLKSEYLYLNNDVVSLNCYHNEVLVLNEKS